MKNNLGQEISSPTSLNQLAFATISLEFPLRYLQWSKIKNILPPSYGKETCHFCWTREIFGMRYFLQILTS